MTNVQIMDKLRNYIENESGIPESLTFSTWASDLLIPMDNRISFLNMDSSDHMKLRATPKSLT